MLVPTTLLANVPVAPVVINESASPPKTPTSVALLLFKVALVVVSYALLLAVSPVTVRGAGVMFAVSAGWTSA